MLNHNVLVLGATSDIALALAAKFAQEKYTLTLAARDVGKTAVIARDLMIRYNTTVETIYFDAVDFSSHQKFYASLKNKPDIVVCVFGFLGEQRKAEMDWDEAAKILHSNFTGAVSILNIVARDFEEERRGIIVGISSVAGDRGRQSNYFYGSAKAGFSAYLSGLRNRLYNSNVHVITVKPGFMKTRMIEGMKTPAPLTADPLKVADRIYKAIRSKKNVIYVLPVWRFIMFVILLIPENIFKRLKL